jgi:hypothetical protein
LINTMAILLYRNIRLSMYIDVPAGSYIGVPARTDTFEGVGARMEA